MVGIDFMGPLPPSSRNQYILLINDHFTKWHEVTELPDQSALTTAKALMDHWITSFGCPESLHSDQGRKFEPKLFTSLTKLLQLDKVCTTAFQPQSHAVIERTNRTLLNMLAKTCWIKTRAISLNCFHMQCLHIAHLSSIQQATRPISYFWAKKRPSY